MMIHAIASKCISILVLGSDVYCLKLFHFICYSLLNTLSSFTAHLGNCLYSRTVMLFIVPMLSIFLKLHTKHLLRGCSSQEQTD